MKHTYVIDGKDFTVDVDTKEKFAFGEDEVLTEKFNDITQSMPWYDEGFTVLNSENFYDEGSVLSAIEASVKRIITELSPEKDLGGFTLEKYHQFVDDNEHNEVIKKTRRLTPAELGFDVEQLIQNFSDYIGADLGFKIPSADFSHWVIVRINRPETQGYNPVHKDIYEMYEILNHVDKMINIWIPVCGVNENAGLPVAPKSHKLSEAQLLKTKPGSSINDQKYAVNSILSWDGDVTLETIVPKFNEFVMFSSFLVHGLAVNWNKDITRVSLEFRLYDQR